MRAVLAILIVMQVSTMGPERNFEELRTEDSVCRMFKLAVAVSGRRSISLAERCDGWR